MSDRSQVAGEAAFGVGFCALYLLILAPFAWWFGQLGAVGRLGLGFLAILPVALVLGLLVSVVVGLAKKVAGERQVEGPRMIAQVALVIVLALAWAAFLALDLRIAGAGMPTWAAVVLAVLGAVGAYLGYGLLAVIFRGELHFLAALPASLLGYVLFAAWPAAAWALFGWCYGPILGPWPP